ncbi:hypothetical protein Brsp07_05405 [Brucella sp. NBRC 14130]
MTLKTILLSACSVVAFAGLVSAESLTIATVNNGDMVRMQSMAADFTSKYPDIEFNWVTLEENVLRERVTTDIATKGGQYDVMTIGTYEAPIWAKQGWLTALDGLGADYDVDDLLPAIRGALSVEGKLYAAPFYGESAMVMYRKDLFEKAGLKMPQSPTWAFIGEAARKITDRSADINGICLRGKAGWGENMAFLPALNNSFGGRWFRREVAAAVRPAGMEGLSSVLCRPDEGCRAAGRLGTLRVAEALASVSNSVSKARLCLSAKNQQIRHDSFQTQFFLPI